MSQPEQEESGPERELPRHLISLKGGSFNTLSTSDYLDRGAFGREVDAFDKRLNDVNASLVLGIDPKAERGKRASRFDDLGKFQAALDFVAEQFKKELVGDYDDNAVFRVLQLGGYLVASESLRQQTAIAGKFPGGDAYGNYTELMRFRDLFCLDVKVGRISINDIVADNKGEISLPDAYAFLTGVLLMKHLVSHNEILSQNQTELTRDYPNLARFGINLVSSLMIHLGRVSPKALKDAVALGRKGIPREAVVAVRGFQDRIYNLQERIFSSIIDPASHDFSALKEAVLGLLEKGDRYINLVALQALSGLVVNTNNLYDLYRTAQEFIVSGTEPEFYKAIRGAIFALADEITPEDGRWLLTKDDLPTVFNTNDNNGEVRNVPTFEDLKREISTIFSKSGVTHYTVELGTADLFGFIDPALIHIEFGSQPLEFSLLLKYEDKFGYELHLRFTFDTRRGNFDWNVLDSPQDESMNRFRSAVFQLAGLSLQQIKEQAAEAYRARKTSGKQEVRPSNKKVKSGHFRDETYGMRRLVRVEARERRENGVPVILERQPDQPQEEEAGGKINIQQDAELNKLLSNVSVIDARIVLDRINRFNEQGLGELKRIRKRSKLGDILYSLRVNCSVPGGIRVVVRETGTSDTGRNFEIVDVRYRKDIYRRLGIES